MRILSPASDVPTLAPLGNDTKNTESIVNKETETMSARTSSIVVTSTVPTVVLDTDVVSDNMAARLCTSFLGHVLFLKNQVPFPIVQLARIPTSDNTTRAAKKRHELLNSFDTLASHLYTTFIALSTALALRGTPEKAEAGREEEALLHRRKHGVARAFFAVALGPTVGTAKSRVMVGIDGLETKVWGLPEDNINKATQTCPVSEEDHHDHASESASDTDDKDEEGGSEGSGSISEQEEDDSGSDDDESPPPSRSPSPVLSSDADSSPSTSSLNAPSKSSLLRAEDPETVRAAERLLSRTLASACSEDDGQGLAAEMAPTQIHVLLRAPRRFDHPSWIPRQNLYTSLDSCLADFLIESGQTPASCDTTTKKRKASRVQGVWIKSRGSSIEIEGSEEDLAEEDELIWWSWDGKLAGFADW